MRLVVDHADPTDRTEPYGPLVCLCAEPDADLRRNFGECRTCRRKPLALMAHKFEPGEAPAAPHGGEGPAAAASALSSVTSPGSLTEVR